MADEFMGPPWQMDWRLQRSVSYPSRQFHQLAPVRTGTESYRLQATIHTSGPVSSAGLP